MQRPWLKCLAPVAGIFFGSLFGWFLHFIIKPSPTADFAVRLFMLLFAIFGWALTTVIDGKKLHCGGTQKIDAATKRRYKWQGGVAASLAFAAPVLLVSELWYLYFPCMFILVVFFLGEIGWGRPSRMFDLKLE